MPARPRSRTSTSSSRSTSRRRRSRCTAQPASASPHAHTRACESRAATRAGSRGSIFLKIDLVDVLVSSFEMAGAESGDDRPTESVSLNFTKFDFQYQPPVGDLVDVFAWNRPTRRDSWSDRGRGSSCPARSTLRRRGRRRRASRGVRRGRVHRRGGAEGAPGRHRAALADFDIAVQDRRLGEVSTASRRSSGSSSSTFRRRRGVDRVLDGHGDLLVRLGVAIGRRRRCAAPPASSRTTIC